MSGTMTTMTMTDARVLEGLNIRYECDVPLGPLTWYGVGGPAAVLAHPASYQQLSALAARCHETGMPVYVLGNGANLLVGDEGVEGVVVQLDDPAFRRITIEGSVVRVGAGFDLFKLLLATVKAGLGGLECLAGIPASVGGAIRMNAGGAFGDIGQVVERVMVCDACGQIYYRKRDDLEFGYRRTNIVARYILEAELRLWPEDPESLMKRVKEIFMYKKNSQPMGDRSAGCVFKNPKLGVGVTERISAGRLIDQAGLKGHRIGGAEVSVQHANFIVAHQGCTASDIKELVRCVQEVVVQRTGMGLECEIVTWP